MKKSPFFVLASVSAVFVARAALKFLSSWFLFQLPLILIACLLVLSYVVHELYIKRRHLPPGPVPLLVLGNMLSCVLNADIDKLFSHWRQKYGGIYTFWMGPVPMVFVSDLEIMKKYFVRHADSFSHRWRNFITETMLDGFNGVVQIDGEKWREQRRFSLHVLRDFGVGRAIMEDKILHQVDILMKHFDATLHLGPMDVAQPIAVCVGNIINNMLFSNTFEHTDKDFQRMQKMLDKQVRIVLNPIMGLYLVAPWTTKVPLLNGKWKELMEIRDTLWSILALQIEDHKRQFNPHADPSDFTFAYLREIWDRQQSDRGTSYFSEKQLQMLTMDLFFAGMETTVTTAKWGILQLMLHQDVQRKAQAELDALPKGNVLLADRLHLTYINALINEIQRTANILPINLLRAVAEDVEIDGFRFPAGSMVLPQISILMNDPAHFPEPDEFRPERFIDENRNLRKIDALLPFSLGKRQCLGESLARAELFLIFANLLRNFEFHCEDTERPPSLQRMYGLTVSPKTYKCVIRRRNQAL